MIRIMIKWDFLSPLLRVASGTIKVEDIIIGVKKELLFKCKIKREQGAVGYNSIDPKEDYPNKLFEELKPILDTMVDSYFRGMILQTNNYEWVDSSADKSFEDWAEERGIPTEQSIHLRKEK